MQKMMIMTPSLSNKRNSHSDQPRRKRPKWSSFDADDSGSQLVICRLKTKIHVVYCHSVG